MTVSGSLLVTVVRLGLMLPTCVAAAVGNAALGGKLTSLAV